MSNSSTVDYFTVTTEEQAVLRPLDSGVTESFERTSTPILGQFGQASFPPMEFAFCGCWSGIPKSKARTDVLQIPDPSASWLDVKPVIDSKVTIEQTG
jgi:hypothetical protein